VLASLATSLLAFQFTFGLCRSATGGDLCADEAAVTGWFDTHRKPCGVAGVGRDGDAPMTMSPLAAWLISNHDWRISMRIIALVVAAIMIPVSLLVRRAARTSTARPLRHRARRRSGDVARAGAALAAIHHPAADELLCCATLRGRYPHRELRRQLRHTDDRRGHDLQRPRASREWAAVSPSACSAIALAPSACWCWALLAQAFGALGYVFVRELAAFNAVAAVFGFIYAGTMPAVFVLVRENFPLRMMGT